MIFIDSHVHLHFDNFDEDREEVISRARSDDIKYFINIGTDLETSKRSVEIAENHDNIFAAVGFHPYDAGNFNKTTSKELVKLLKKDKVVALGEIGLDYYRDITPKDVQKKVLVEQLKIALGEGKPFIIHCRDAWDDIEEVIDNTVNGKANGVFHCYTGGLETAIRLVNKNYLISFGGNITFNNYKDTDVLYEVPIESMLIETDSPFLTPMPFRGKRNEPKNVRFVAQKIADIKKLSIEDAARITAFNANRMFGIAPEMETPKFTYTIRDSLYINPTIRCTADCVFCARLIDPVVKGHNLNIKKEPTVKETISEIKDPTNYKEIVFCGYGEPTLRLDFIKQVAKWVKDNGGTTRLNTNGHGNLHYGRDITPELKGLIDEVSTSLNSHDPNKYDKIMRNDYDGSFEGMLDFTKKVVEAGIKATLTIVDMPGINIEKCEKLAKDSGAEFKIRTYNEVG